MMMIMSMGRGYVSELRPSTGLFFIPQVINEHGEPWWNNDVDRGELLIRLPQLSRNLPPELSGSKREKQTKGMRI
jgi:hypothetical protein